MARLGRGRRSGAKIARGRSTTTAASLVRKRLVQTPVANDRAGVYARVFRRKRAHIVVRGRPVATPTPLVRKRVLQTPNGNDRAFTVARIWRRKRAHITVKAPQAGPGVPRGTQPTVGRAGWRASIRARMFQQRGAHLAHGVSATTPTPLIRRRLVLSPNANERSRFRASWLKPRPRKIVNPPAPAAVVNPARQRQPVTALNRRSRLRARLAHDLARISRSTVTAVAGSRGSAVTGHGDHRSRLVRARRRHSITLRAFVQQVTQLRPRSPIVTRNATRAGRLKTRRQHARVVQTRVVIPTPLVRHTPIVSRPRRDRTRAYYARHRAHYETSTLGSAAPPVVIVVGFYDTPTPATGYDTPTATAASYAQPTPTPGYDEPSLAAGYDQPTLTDGSYDE